jgi:hypothetical protein
LVSFLKINRQSIKLPFFSYAFYGNLYSTLLFRVLENRNQIYNNMAYFSFSSK